MVAKIAIIFYSLYSHNQTVAEAAIKAVEGAGAEAKIFQVPETLSDEVREKMHAAPRKAEIPVIQPADLKDYDGFIFAIPTRYGRAVAQMSAFFDATGGLWATQALSGKFATVMSSTGTQNGAKRQRPSRHCKLSHIQPEPFFAHHGINFVPWGYVDPGQLTLEEIKGGSPWGAGTLAGADGSRQPSALELGQVKGHAEHFTSIVVQFKRGADRAAKEKAAGGVARPRAVAEAREGNASTTSEQSNTSSTSGTSSQKKKKKRFSVDNLTKGFKKLLHPSAGKST